MLTKKCWFVFVLIAVLAFGVVTVFAGEDSTDEDQCPGVYNEDEETWVYNYFCDGRLNSWDLTQPVAIYYDTTAVPVWNLVTTEDEEGEEVEKMEQQMAEVVSAIHVWSVDAKGNGQMALYVPVAQIEPALSATAPVEIAAANGITLSYSPAVNMFTVTAPNGYVFTWEKWEE